MRVLIVEDEMLLRAQIDKSLRDADFVVDMAADGQEALYRGREFLYDAAVIDLGLPKVDGMRVIRTLRQEGSRVPIVILTARSGWHEKVTGLEAGADDYLTKPFSMEELIARVRAVIRRAKGYASNRIELGPLEVDTVRKEARVQNQAVQLTAFEYRLLAYLALNASRTVSKAELTEHLYEQDFERDSNVIEVLVGRLRRKLDPGDALKPIRTVRGHGYRLVLGAEDH